MELLHRAYQGQDSGIVDYIRDNINTLRDIPFPAAGDDKLWQAYLTDMTDGANLINAAYILGTDKVRAQMTSAFQLKDEVLAYVQAQRQWIEQTRNQKLDFCEAAHTGALDRLKHQPEIYDWDMSKEPKSSEKWYASWVMIAMQVAKNDTVQDHLQSKFAYMFISQPIDDIVIRPYKTYKPRTRIHSLSKTTLLQSLQQKVQALYIPNTHLSVEMPVAAMVAGNVQRSKSNKNKNARK